jgi:hypothetical protein
MISEHYFVLGGYSESYYSGKIFCPLFGHIQTLYNRTYQTTFAFDVLNNTIVYFNFYDHKVTEGYKTRRNMLPDNNLLNIIQIMSRFCGISSFDILLAQRDI